MKKRNEIPQKATTVLALPECWIDEGNGIMNHLKDSVRSPKLPWIDRKFEYILVELGIPYQVVSENEVEYWNPDHYEVTEKTFPVYERTAGAYLYTGIIYSDHVPSLHTISEAKKLSEKIEKKKQEILEIQLKDRFYHQAYRELGEDVAIGYSSSINEEECTFDYLRVFPVRIPSKKTDSYYKTEYYAVFNTQKIQPNTLRITLQVPKGTEGLFIGSYHWQVNEWAKKLGVHEIRVVGI